MTLTINKETMRTITLEEHYVTPAYLDGPGQQLKASLQPRPANQAQTVFDQLCDLSERRVADMDDAGIDVQILSIATPGVEQLEAAEAEKVARESNDYVAEAVKRYPTRLGVFATLPTAAPIKAADELERTIHEYGFKGAVINGHIRGRYLDDKFFWPILERAEALRVPIYLHPTRPPQPVIDASYSGSFSQEVTALLAASAWGWHIETATHVLRLILGGAFDKYPDLQLIIGHLGEALPFMLPRIDNNLTREVTKLERPVESYLRENIHYTFSGFNYVPAFLDLLLEVGLDRIMFSVDYPYRSMAEACSFLGKLPLSPADKHRILHINAEHLLRL